MKFDAELAQVRYRNPHAEVEVDYGGKRWLVILAPIRRMESRGLPSDALEVGKTVTIEGYPRSDGTAVVTGDITLESLSEPVLDLAVTLNDFEVMGVDNETDAEFRGTLALTGPLDGLLEVHRPGGVRRGHAHKPSLVLIDQGRRQLHLPLTTDQCHRPREAWKGQWSGDQGG